MYDAILAAKDRALTHSSILSQVGVDDGEYILATIHRAGNTDDPERLRSILAGLGDAPVPVVFPVHPRTRAALETHDLWEFAADRLELIEPVGYLDFVRLIAGAERIATDSGGVQKEAFYLDRPCVTLREETEWVELVDAGWNRLVGADRRAIREALSGSIDLPKKPSLYGDGNAATNIVTALSGAVPVESTVLGS
jgi:UDP-N-acetylglucosamine 2-epimerase (non-hydrolysing)